MSSRRILVTGGTGFIGGNLVRRLIDDGHHVRCLVRDTERATVIFDGLDVELVAGDVTDPAGLGGVAEEVEIVYHMAALMGHDMPSPEALERFRGINVEGTRNIAIACGAAGVGRFVHVSSTAAMGLLDVDIVTEETPCDPFTPYQVTKLESEQVAREVGERTGMSVVVLRPSMVFGPGFKGDFLTTAKVVKTGFFPRLGRGENLSPALFVTDCIEALVAAGDEGRAGETYLVSSKESFALADVARIIAGALGGKVRQVYVPVWLAVAGAWTLERLASLLGKHSPVSARNIRSTVTDRVFDTGKASRELGFEPEVGLEEGLTLAVGYFREQGWV